MGMRRGLCRWLAPCALAMAVLGCCGCGGAVATARLAGLGSAALSCGSEEAAWRGLEAYGRWYHAIVLSRVREVDLVARDALSFGPWQARDDIDALEASDTGELTCWQVDYYITHNWSEYGQGILDMQGGDWVTINGRDLVVRRVLDYPKDGTLGEVYELADEGDVVLQTCVPGSDYNRLVFCQVV